jgi:hypothetical protein
MFIRYREVNFMLFLVHKLCYNEIKNCPKTVWPKWSFVESIPEASGSRTTWARSSTAPRFRPADTPAIVITNICNYKYV